jgi:hypothetical protein
MRTATVQQMAAMLVSAPEWSFAKFEVLALGPREFVLRFLVSDEHDWVRLQSTREPGCARVFATIEAAIRQAQAVAVMAGHAPNHLWDSQPGGLRCMLSISVSLDTAL